MNSFLKVLPNKILKYVLEENTNEITEIRLRANQNMYIRKGSVEINTEYIVQPDDLIDILKRMSFNSIYAIQNYINQGYIAMYGCRVGITGEVVTDGENGIKNIKNISSINIRILHDVHGVSNTVLPKILNCGIVTNTLIVSPPGFGKTTLLRDIIRNLSYMGKNVGVVDERGEIAGMYLGNTSLDLGPRTDVISYIDRPRGIEFLVRSMGLDVIATDEISNEKDILAVSCAMASGVKVIATAHGDEERISDILKSNICIGGFENVIYLSGEIGKISKVVNVLSLKKGVDAYVI